MIRTILSLLVSILVFSVSSPVWAGDPVAPLSTPELKQVISAGKKNTIVFFLNPMGGPCRSQNGILQQLQKDKGSSFNIVYVSSLEQQNQQAFYDYGVRNLPSMVIVNKQGKITTVFPPGIQSYETLAAALEKTR